MTSDDLEAYLEVIAQVIYNYKEGFISIGVAMKLIEIYMQVYADNMVKA